MKDYTVKEAADVVGVARTTIMFHIRQKNIKAEQRIMERTKRPIYYITEDELMRFIGAYERGFYGKPGWTRGKLRTP